MAILAVLPPATACGQQQSLPSSTWVTYDSEGSPEIHLYFFWSNRCPHCLEAKPFIDTMASIHPWLKLHSHQLIGNPAGTELFRSMAARIGEEARAVPGFMFCGELMIGYDADETTGRSLQRKLVECYRQHVPEDDSR